LTKHEKSSILYGFALSKTRPTAGCYFASEGAHEDEPGVEQRQIQATQRQTNALHILPEIDHEDVR